MRTNRSQFISRIFALVMVLCLMLSVAVTASAASINQAVTDAKKGVVQIQVWFNDPVAAVEAPLHSGTGFLINENTVVTCQHVATGFPDAWYVNWAKETNEKYGGNRTAADVKEGLELRISVYRDIYVKATVKKASTEMDYAILTLNETINDRVPLAIRDSSDLAQTEEVFALGFPGDINDLEDKNVYTADDVTITSGNVNKIADMTFETTDGGKYDGVNCIESSALITGGNSGGPLVDTEGRVVGINAAGNETRNIAISSNQLISVLKALNIPFTPAPGPGPVPPIESSDVISEEPDPVGLDTGRLSGLIAQAEAKNAADYTEASYNALRDALANAKAAMNATTQSEIDNAAAGLDAAIGALAKAEAESSMNTYVIIGIVAFVVVVIIAIILVLVLGKKKKPAAPAKPAAPVAPPVRPATPGAPVKPAAPAFNPNGAEDTVVLSQKVYGGTLIRTGTNERVSISAAEFSVGREKNSVDYCVTGNNNISRIHARFVVRGATTFIVDNKAANGTFVNGVKLRPGQELELKNGDKILLANEKFDFNK